MNKEKKIKNKQYFNIFSRRNNIFTFKYKNVNTYNRKRKEPLNELNIKTIKSNYNMNSFINSNF